MATATANPTTLEAQIQTLGRDLFARVRSRQGKTSAAWWNNKLMDFALKDEKMKLQLFRFVDVLPSLRSSDDVAKHLKEYFDSPGAKFPAFVSWGASLAAFSSLAAMASTAAIRKSVEEMSRNFIAGQTPAEALKAVTSYRKKNLCVTLDALGEAVVSESEADEYQQKNLEFLDAMIKAAPGWPGSAQIDQGPRGEIPRVNLSLKLTSLYSQIDPMDSEGSARAVERRLIPILERAKAGGAFINWDMEDYRVKDFSLALFKRVAMRPEFRTWAEMGVVIQGYLKDSEKDLDELIAWAKQRGTPVSVRLVKGAYWDYERILAKQNGWPVPVWEHKPETDAHYESLVKKLIGAHPHLEAAIASHNIRSLACALAAAQERGLPKNAFEFQGLYGMADPIKESLAEMGYRVRVYMPFGDLLPGMAYLVRRLLENTANESFLKQGFVDGLSEDKLLTDPAKSPAPLPVQKMKPEFENEPDLEFHKEAVRKKFLDALQFVEKNLGKSYPLVINGKKLKGDAGEITSVNPSNTTQVVGKAASASVAQADAAVSIAVQNFPAWRDTPVTERATILRKAAALMRKRQYELAAWEVFESAKPWREADGDIGEAIDFLEYYALHAEKLQTPKRRSEVPAEINEDYYQPRGVAVVIAPWNFPLAILCGMTSAALATGNTVIIKPAEQTPVIAALFADILLEAGVPPGVVSYLPGIGETVGARLVEHPQVNLIAFTGSMPVGLKINEIAARTKQGMQGVKKVICEMGGKNAIIVDADADLDEAVAGVLRSAFGFAGQKCSACSRAIVVGNAYEPFIERLSLAVKSLKVSAAIDPGCSVPPVIDADARERILSYIAKGKQESKVAVELDVSALAKQGTFVGPVVFRDVAPNASIAQEEIFGPVLAVLPAKDFKHALEIAADVPYALTGGLFSRSPAHIAQAHKEFRVGNLYLNRGCTGAKVNRHPFGGFKLSGIGSKAGGGDYLLQFVEPRCVTENTLRRGFAPDE